FPPPEGGGTPSLWGRAVTLKVLLLTLEFGTSECGIQIGVYYYTANAAKIIYFITIISAK
ncbi:MAG: hypothetical protein JXR70_16805, partial [Spirochaetales bacterium]|nr:hypothetical protein [Spirochaetales bacterium]